MSVGNYINLRQAYTSTTMEDAFNCSKADLEEVGEEIILAFKIRSCQGKP